MDRSRFRSSYAATSSQLPYIYQELRQQNAYNQYKQSQDILKAKATREAEYNLANEETRKKMVEEDQLNQSKQKKVDIDKLPWEENESLKNTFITRAGSTGYKRKKNTLIESLEELRNNPFFVLMNEMRKDPKYKEYAKKTDSKTAKKLLKAQYPDIKDDDYGLSDWMTDAWNSYRISMNQAQADDKAGSIIRQQEADDLVNNVRDFTNKQIQLEDIQNYFNAEDAYNNALKSTSENRNSLVNSTQKNLNKAVNKLKQYYGKDFDPLNNALNLTKLYGDQSQLREDTKYGYNDAMYTLRDMARTHGDPLSVTAKALSDIIPALGVVGIDRDRVEKSLHDNFVNLDIQNPRKRLLLLDQYSKISRLNKDDLKKEQTLEEAERDSITKPSLYFQSRVLRGNQKAKDGDIWNMDNLFYSQIQQAGFSSSSWYYQYPAMALNMVGSSLNKSVVGSVIGAPMTAVAAGLGYKAGRAENNAEVVENIKERTKRALKGEYDNKVNYYNTIIKNAKKLSKYKNSTEDEILENIIKGKLHVSAKANEAIAKAVTDSFIQARQGANALYDKDMAAVASDEATNALIWMAPTGKIGEGVSRLGGKILGAAEKKLGDKAVYQFMKKGGKAAKDAVKYVTTRAGNLGNYEKAFGTGGYVVGAVANTVGSIAKRGVDKVIEKGGKMGDLALRMCNDVDTVVSFAKSMPEALLQKVSNKVADKLGTDAFVTNRVMSRAAGKIGNVLLSGYSEEIEEGKQYLNGQEWINNANPDQVNSTFDILFSDLSKNIRLMPTALGVPFGIKLGLAADSRYDELFSNMAGGLLGGMSHTSMITLGSEALSEGINAATGKASQRDLDHMISANAYIDAKNSIGRLQTGAEIASKLNRFGYSQVQQELKAFNEFNKNQKNSGNSFVEDEYIEEQKNYIDAISNTYYSKKTKDQAEKLGIKVGSDEYNRFVATKRPYTDLNRESAAAYNAVQDGILNQLSKLNLPDEDEILAGTVGAEEETTTNPILQLFETQDSQNKAAEAVLTKKEKKAAKRAANKERRAEKRRQRLIDKGESDEIAEEILNQTVASENETEKISKPTFTKLDVLRNGTAIVTELLGLTKYLDAITTVDNYSELPNRNSMKFIKNRIESRINELKSAIPQDKLKDLLANPEYYLNSIENAEELQDLYQSRMAYDIDNETYSSMLLILTGDASEGQKRLGQKLWKVGTSKEILDSIQKTIDDNYDFIDRVNKEFLDRNNQEEQDVQDAVRTEAEDRELDEMFGSDEEIQDVVEEPEQEVQVETQPVQTADQYIPGVQSIEDQIRQQEQAAVEAAINEERENIRNEYKNKIAKDTNSTVVESEEEMRDTKGLKKGDKITVLNSNTKDYETFTVDSVDKDGNVKDVVNEDGLSVIKNGVIIPEDQRRKIEEDKTKPLSVEQQSSLDNLNKQIEEDNKNVVAVTGHDYFIKDSDGKTYMYPRVHTIKPDKYEVEPTMDPDDPNSFFNFNKNKIAEFVRNNDTEGLKEFIKDIKNYQLYIDQLNGNEDYVINALATLVSKSKAGVAVNVGQIFDEFIRIFFDEEITIPLDYNTMEVNTGIDKNTYPIKNFMSKEQFDNLISDLNKLKEEYDKLGYKISSKRHTWYGKIIVNGKYQRIAGETDLIAIDQDGKYHIIDTKTTKSSFKDGSEYFDKLKPLYGRNQTKTTRQDYAEQLSYYMAIIKSAMPSVEFAQNPIELLPIIVTYDRHSTEEAVANRGTTKIKASNGQNNEPQRVELTPVDEIINGKFDDSEDRKNRLINLREIKDNLVQRIVGLSNNLSLKKAQLEAHHPGLSSVLNSIETELKQLLDSIREPHKILRGQPSGSEMDKVQSDLNNIADEIQSALTNLDQIYSENIIKLFNDIPSAPQTPINPTVPNNNNGWWQHNTADKREVDKITDTTGKVNLRDVTGNEDFATNSVTEVTRIEQGPTTIVHCDITYDGKIFKNVPIQVAKNAKGQAFISSVQRLMDGKLDGLKVVLTKMDRTAGRPIIIPTSNITESNGIMQGRTIYDLSTEYNQSDSKTRFGIAKADKNGIVHIHCQGATGGTTTIIYTFPKGKGIPGVLYTVIKPNNNNATVPTEPLDMPIIASKLSEGDADFLIELLDGVVSYGGNVNNTYEYTTKTAESYNLPFTYKDMIEMFIPYGKMTNYNKARHIEVNGTIVTFTYPPTSNTDTGTVSYNLADVRSRDALKTYLQTLPINIDENKINSRLGLANSTNTKHPFKRIADFFRKHPEISSLAFGKSRLTFGKEDFITPDGNTKGISGLGWMAKNGMLNTNYGGVSNPRFSYNDTEYQNQTPLDNSETTIIEDNNEVVDDYSFAEVDDIIDDVDTSGDYYDFHRQHGKASRRISKEKVVKRTHRMFGSRVPIHVVDNLARVLTDIKIPASAVGAMIRGAIYLQTNAERGSEYHEAFHTVSRHMLPKSIQKRMYKIISNIIKDEQGNEYLDRLKKSKQYENALEEYGAEICRRYFNRIEDIPFQWRNIGKYISDHIDAFKEIGSWRMAVMFTVMRSGALRFAPMNINNEKWLRELTYDRGNAHYHNIINDAMYDTLVHSLAYYFLRQQNIAFTGKNLNQLRLDKEYLDVKKLKRDRVTGKPIFDKNHKPVTFTVREAILNSCTDYDKETNTRKETVTSLAVKEMFENWDEVKKDIKTYMDEIGIDYHEKEEAEREQELVDGSEDQSGALDHNYDKASYETARVTKATVGIKIITSMIRANGVITKVKGKLLVRYGKNAFGLYEFMDSKEVLNMMLSELHGVKTKKLMLDRIHDLAQSDAMFYQLDQQIQHINNTIKNKSGQTNYNNQQFVTQLFNLMSCSKNNFVRITAERDYKTGKYNMKVENCGEAYEASQYRMEWGRILMYGGTKLLEMSPEGKIVSKQLNRGTAANVLGSIFEKMNEMKNEFSRVLLDKLADHGTPNLKLRNPDTGKVEPCNVLTEDGCNNVIDSLCQMFNYIGIQFDAPEFRYMLRQKYEIKGYKTILSQLEQFFNQTAKENIELLWGSDRKLIRKKSDGEYELNITPDNQILANKRIPAENIYLNNSFVSELSEWKYRYLHSTTDLSVLVSNGKTYYEISENNLITDVTDDLASGGNIVSDLTKFVYNYADIQGIDENGQETSAQIGSVILKQVLEAKKEAEQNGYSSINLPFQVNTLSQFKTNEYGDSGLDYFKISEREDYTGKCTILEQGGLIFPTMSDKKTWVYISGVNMPGIHYENIEGTLKATNLDGTDVLDQLIEYAELERLTVDKTIQQLKTLPENQKVTNFHKGAKIKDAQDNTHIVANGTLFGSFTGIYDENGKFISFVDQLDENGKYITPEENLNKANKLFFSKTLEEKRAIISRTLDKQVDLELQHLQEIGLIGVEYGHYVNKGLNDKALTAIAAEKGIGAQWNSAVLKDYVRDIVSKSIISIHEVERCYSGHPGFFKYKFDKQGHLINRHEDEFKRFGGLISTGTNNDYEIEGTPKDGKYTCAVVKNEMVQSPQIEYITEKIANAEWRLALRNIRINNGMSLKEQMEICSEISKMSIEDIKKEIEDSNKIAFDIISKKIEKETNSYRIDSEKHLEGIDVADGGAYISPEMTKWLLQMCGEYDNKVAKAFHVLMHPEAYDGTTQEDAYALVTTKVIGAQKYTAYGQRLSEDGTTMIPYYNKMALFPVFKCTATGKFAKIYDLMLNNKDKDDKPNPIHMLMIKSAVKLGDQGAVEYTTDDEKFEGFNTYKQEFKYLRKQFNTNPHHKEDQSMGTQMVKVALSSLIKGKVYKTVNGSKTGQLILDEIMGDINKLTRLGQKEFRDLVYDENGEIDPKKFSEFLKDQLSSRDADKSILESIEAVPIKDQLLNTIGWKLRHPLAAISRMNWLLSILKSVIDKRMVEIHTPGNAFYQRSIWSMEGKATDYVSGIDLPKDLNEGNELKMIVEDGPAKGAMECVLTIDYFNDILKQIGLEKAPFSQQKKALEEAGIIGKNAKTNLIGYRIPTQAQSSIHALVCRDVVPVLQHNIFLPKEFTKITGSDFDIDKIFIASLPYVMHNEDGKYTAEQNTLSEKLKVQNNLLNNYISLLTDEEGMHIANRSIDNDTELVTDVLEELEEGTKDAAKESVSPYAFYTLSKHTSTKLNFLTGKTGIGPFALNNNSLILTTLYGVKFSSTSVMRVLGHSSLCRQTDDDNQSIMSWISALINAHVDIAKDPYISRLNVNEMTYNLVNLLIRTGYGKRTFYFTKQPVMIAMANKYRQAQGSFLQDKDRSKWEIRNEAKHDAAVEICGEALLKLVEQEMLDEDGKLTDRGIQIANQVLNNAKDVTKRAARGELKGDAFKTLQAYVYIVDKVLEQPAQSLSDLVKYSKIDTKKQGKNVSEQLAYIRGVEKVFGDNFFTKDLFGKSNITKITGEEPTHSSRNEGSMDFDKDSITRMYEKSFIKDKTRLAINQFMSVMKGLTFEATPGFQNLLDRFCQYLGKTDAESINDITLAISAKIKAKAINDFARANNIDIHGLVSGNNTIYDRLNIIKRKLVADPAYADVKDNVLLNLLIADKNWIYDRSRHIGHAMDRFPNLKFIRLFDALDKSNSKTDYIISAWDALLNDGAHPDLKDFARDLCIYAFVTSGDKGGRTKLFNYVPNSFRENSGYVKHIENVLQDMMQGEEYGEQMFDDAFIDDVVLNNQDNSTFVRTVDITNKKLSLGKPKWTTVTLNSQNAGNIIRSLGYSPDYPIFISTDVSTPVKFELLSPFIKVRHMKRSLTDESSRAESIYKLVAYVPFDNKGGFPVYVKVNSKGYHIKGGYDYYEYDNDIIDNEYMPNVYNTGKISLLKQEDAALYKATYGEEFMKVANFIEDSNIATVGYKQLHATVPNKTVNIELTSINVSENNTETTTNSNEQKTIKDNNIYHHRTIADVLKQELAILKLNFKNSKSTILQKSLIKKFNNRLHLLLDGDTSINVAMGASSTELRDTPNLHAIDNYIDIESSATDEELTQLWNVLSSKFNKPFVNKRISADQMVKISGNFRTKCFIKSEGDLFVVYTIDGENPSYTQLAEELLHPLVRTIQKNNSLVFNRFLREAINEAKKDKTLLIIIGNIGSSYKGKPQDVIDNEVVTQSLAYFMKNAEKVTEDRPIYNAFMKIIKVLLNVLNEVGFDWFDAAHKISLRQLAYVLKFENIKLDVDNLDLSFEHIQSGETANEILDNSEFTDLKNQLQLNGISDDNYAMRMAIHKTRNSYMDEQEAIFTKDFIDKQVQHPTGFFAKVINYFKSKWNKGRIKDPTLKLKDQARDTAYKEFNETLYHENITAIIKKLTDQSNSKELIELGNLILKLYDEDNRNAINDIMSFIDIANTNTSVIINTKQDIYRILRILKSLNSKLYEDGITEFTDPEALIQAIDSKDLSHYSQSQQDYVNNFVRNVENWMQSNMKENVLGELSTMFFQHDTSLRCPNEEAYNAIKSGLESRLISIKRGNMKTSKDVVYNIKSRISKLRSMNMYDVADMYKVFYDFLDLADVELGTAIRFFNKCNINNKNIDAERLMYFKTDVIGYYQYIINNYINSLSNESGLSDQQIQELKELFEKSVEPLLNEALKLYKQALDSYTANVVDNYIANHVDLGDNVAFKRMAQDALHNKINEGAIGLGENIFGDPNSSKSVIVRIIANTLNDVERDVHRITLRRSNILKRKYKACESFLSKMGDPRNYMKNFVELDDEGRPTRYFIRSINYGLFEKDQKTFEDKLRKNYKLPSDEHGNTIWHWETDGTEDTYNKYQDELDDWLEDHANRRFTSDYYKTRRKFITYTVRQQLNPINELINLLYDKCRGEDGFIYVNKLSLNERNLLNSLQHQRLELSNPYTIEYDSVGNIIKLEKKTGEALEIAEAIQAWNKERAKHIKRNNSHKKYDEALAKITDPAERAVFEAENMKEMIDPEFYELLSQCSTATQTEEYLKASAERGKILSATKEDGQYIPNILKLNDLAWSEISRLEQELEQLRVHGSGKAAVNFDDIAEKRMILMQDPQMPTATITVLDYFKRQAHQRLATDPNAMTDFYAKYYIKVTDSKGRDVLRPLNAFYYVYPKDPKYITKMTVGSYIEYDKSGWINDLYDDNDSNVVQPKDSKYHNNKFDKLMSNLKTKAFYEEIIKMMDEAIKLLPSDVNTSKYKLPQITDNGASILSRNLLSKNYLSIAKGFAQYFTINENDTDFYNENRAVRPDNTIVESIPMRFILDLKDPSLVSCDILKTVTMFYQMALNFSKKSEKVPQMETLIQEMSNKNSELLKRALTELEMYGYGRMSKGINDKPGLKMSEKLKRITKTINNFRNIANLSMLAGNVYSATKGAISAQWQVLIGGIVGKYYAMDDLLYSYSKILTGTFDAIGDLGSNQVHNLLLAAMQYNGAARSIEDIFGNKHRSRLSRIMDHFKMGLFTVGDYTSNAMITAAVYHATRLIEVPNSPGEYKFVTRSLCIDMFRKAGKNKKQALSAFKHASGNHLMKMYTLKDNQFTLKDKVTVTINGKKKTINPKYYVTDKIENRIAGTIEQRASIANGVISKHGKSSLYQGTLSKLLVTMRGYMISQGYDRLKTGNDFDEKYYEKGGYRSIDTNSNYRGIYNFETGEVEYGTMMSFTRCFTHFNSLMHDFAVTLPLIKNMLSNKEYSSTFTREDILGIKQTIGDIVGTAIFLSLCAFIFIPKSRDYPDSWWLAFGRVVTEGCGIETSTMINIMTPLDLLTTVTTTKSWLDSMMSIFGYIGGAIGINEDNTAYVSSGAYKNKPRWFRYLMKLSKPTGLTGYYESFAPVIPGLDNPESKDLSSDQRNRLTNIKNRKLDFSSEGVSNLGSDIYDTFIIGKPTTKGLDSKFDYYQKNTFPATVLPKRKDDSDSESKSSSSSSGFNQSFSSGFSGKFNF